MLISYSHRFLFVHIPKVAGMSVRAALEPRIYSPAKIVFIKAMRRITNRLGWQRCIPSLSIYPSHLTALEWRNVIPRRTFDSMFKFAFVRNPWDREVSLYHYILQKPLHQHHEDVKRAGCFEKYIEWRVSGHRELQKDYLVDSAGEIIVDFVGRFERLTEDMDHVLRTIGFDNVQLPHINASAHKDYRLYYNDTTRELVEKHFQEDIVRFGYSFDHARRETPTWSPSLPELSDFAASHLHAIS